jgi:hypothetical protein
MRKRALLITLIAGVMLLSSAVAASAVRPDKPPKPPKPTTTTEAPAEFWTCQARIDNGAIWNLGGWDGTAYVAGMTSCTDILTEHLRVVDWTVVWDGIASKGVKGLKLVFEEEINDNVFAEQVFTTESGVWCPTLAGEIENMVFLAMHHNADRWTSFEVTVIPGHQDVCLGA